jgi:hypothetical protein
MNHRYGICIPTVMLQEIRNILNSVKFRIFRIPACCLRKERNTPEITVLPLVLYEFDYETCSLTLWKDHGLAVLKHKMLKRIFGPKRDEVMVSWNKLNEGYFRNLYSTIVTISRMGGACSTHKVRNTFFVGEFEGKRPPRKI